jgi:hypothetical protein
MSTKMPRKGSRVAISVTRSKVPQSCQNIWARVWSSNLAGDQTLTMTIDRGDAGCNSALVQLEGSGYKDTIKIQVTEIRPLFQDPNAS